MKKIVKVGAGLFLLFLCALVVPKEAEAAKKIKPVKIPNRKTISSYDLTGDGKKDKFLIKRTKMHNIITSMDMVMNGRFILMGRVLRQLRTMYLNQKFVCIGSVKSAYIY